jgi:hypothetical protein
MKELQYSALVKVLNSKELQKELRGNQEFAFYHALDELIISSDKLFTLNEIVEEANRIVEKDVYPQIQVNENLQVVKGDLGLLGLIALGHELILVQELSSKSKKYHNGAGYGYKAFQFYLNSNSAKLFQNKNNDLSVKLEKLKKLKDFL